MKRILKKIKIKKEIIRLESNRIYLIQNGFNLFDLDNKIQQRYKELNRV